MQADFYVIGSVNTDLNVTVERFPVPGETVSGSSFSTAFGGKGANQAVALARLCRGKGRVHLAGKVGTDSYGKAYREHLADEGADIDFLDDSMEPTGTALIEIDTNGTNRIVVVPGANGDIDGAWWDKTSVRIKNSDGACFLFQLELPIDVVARAIIDVHGRGGITVLDPAPAAKLPDDIWSSVDYVTPNQTETAFFTGITPKTDEEAIRAAGVFFAMGVRNVIIKAGGDGSWLFTKTERWFCPVFPLKVVDTTAAGDSFNAGFAYAIGAGQAPADALRFANAVGGLSTTKAGAQDAMPDLNTVEALLQAWPKISARRLQA
jgi:ribokinase